MLFAAYVRDLEDGGELGVVAQGPHEVRPVQDEGVAVGAPPDGRCPRLGEEEPDLAEEGAVAERGQDVLIPREHLDLAAAVGSRLIIRELRKSASQLSNRGTLPRTSRLMISTQRRPSRSISSKAARGPLVVGEVGGRGRGLAAGPGGGGRPRPLPISPTD